MSTTTRRASEIHALRTASRIARERPITAPELARQVKAAAPDLSLAAGRRAADVVLAVRTETRTFRGVCESSTTRRETPARTNRTPKAVPSLASRLATHKRVMLLARAARERAEAVRLATHKRAMLLDAFDDAGFRHSRAWDDAGSCTVQYGAPTANQGTSEGWINYKSQGYRKGIVAEHVNLTVPADWDTRVRQAGLAVLDGLLTLDAEQLPTSGAVTVYRAVWARQGRGVSVVVERGFIARHTPTGTVFHSTHRDPQKALSGLARKLTAQGTPPEVKDARKQARAEAKARRLARMLERFSRWDFAEITHVVVTPSDSLKAGNCKPGTEDFVERFFPDRAAATVGEIAQAVGHLRPANLTEANVTLARQIAAAVLVAVRRDKTARRTLALV